MEDEDFAGIDLAELSGLESSASDDLDFESTLRAVQTSSGSSPPRR
jgi:hypothetical protein